MRALAIAGTHSGVGKTTLTLAMIAGLQARGLRVRGFKAGPDFIDAAHLARAAGTGCRNLDPWMMGAEACRHSVAAAAAECDIAIVEGMMGLYDGVRGTSDEGSTAALAKLLELPVVLVADAAGGVRSLAATVLGFQRFDPEIRLAGVMFNRIGGAAHLAMLREAMTSVRGIAVLGGCPADDAIRIPERHLGLSLDATATPEAAWAERHLDLDALLALAAEVPARTAAAETPLAGPRLAVARDAAFCFYYQHNLDLLRAQGIEIAEFSPLREASLPARTSGIYLGGGYPELHAAALSANRAMRQAIADFAARGGFVYAECGGLMYLARELEGHAMAGVLPCSITMQTRPAAIGYRETRPMALLGADAPLARGHEFHYSRLALDPEAAAPAHWARAATDAPGEFRPEGFHAGNVIASYIHLHFASCPALAPAFRRAMDSTASRR